MYYSCIILLLFSQYHNNIFFNCLVGSKIYLQIYTKNASSKNY